MGLTEGVTSADTHFLLDNIDVNDFYTELVARCRRFLDFIQQVWLDSIIEQWPLFVPEYFFCQEPELVPLWQVHAKHCRDTQA